MGFKLSLFHAQEANSFCVSEGKIIESQRLKPRGACIIEGGGQTPFHYLYVDNVGLLGSDKDSVQELKQVATRNLEQHNLLTHVDACLNIR